MDEPGVGSPSRDGGQASLGVTGWSGRWARRLLRGVTGLLPVSVSIEGRRHDLLMRLCDPVLGSRGREVVWLAGTRLELDLDHPAERLLAYAGANVLRAYRRSDLHAFLTGFRPVPGDLFVDIGANLGVYSLLARRLGFDTVLFEPEPRFAAFLVRNARAFGTVIDVALGDRPGTAEFFVASESNPGGSSLVMSTRGWEASGYASAIAVRVERFDHFIVQHGLDPSRVRVVKIDVEGAEASVVEGFEGFLSQGHTPDIWCEVRGPSSDRNPGSHHRVCGLLARHGYVPFVFGDGAFRAFDPADPAPPQVFDLVFRHGGAEPSAAGRP